MARKPFNLEKFVSYNAITRKSTCLIETCRKELCGKLKGNIKRHYKLIHKQDIRSSDESDSEDVPVVKKSKKVNLNTTMDKNEFLTCCVGLVAKKSIPFTIFDDQEYFKKLISPYEQKFNINLNSSSIETILEKTSAHIISEISGLVKQKMICLKIDVASRLERNVLNINIQYINDYKICINTIGMIELNQSHISTYLQDQILNCLKSSGIELNQLYLSMTDNVTDVIKFGQIQEKLQVEETEEDCTLEENDSIDEVNDNIQRWLTPVLPLVTCPAYAIQLAADDVIKTLQEEIADCRKAVNLIRASGVRKELLILGSVTSWNSVFEMFKSLLKLKDIDSRFLDPLDNRSVNLIFVSEYVTAFTPLVKFTKLLQEEQYVFGDFYRDWLNCELELEDISSNIASQLYQAMQSRREKLLEHDAFVAALFLDPRFNFMNSLILSEQQKYQAIEYLVNTFEIIQELGSSRANTQLRENIYKMEKIEPEEFLEEPTTSSSAYAKLTQRIMSSATKSSRVELTFREKLLKLSNTKMVSLDTDILEYLKSTLFDADVLNVINVALAVPVSQVTVERTFSALTLALSKVNTNLSNTTLNNLLITKLNFSEIKSCSVDLDFPNEQDPIFIEVGMPTKGN